VVLAVFTRSFQEGTYAKMIENAVGQFTGYVQVHQKDYWEDKTLDNGMIANDSLMNSILLVPGVDGLNQRLESFSLAAFGNNTKGTLIMGIQPEEEDKMLGLKSKIIKGSYFSKNDKSILIGSKLAEYLKITINDTLVLIGQGHWGQSAIGAFPIKGIIKMPSPIIDRQIIFMPLALSQEYFSFENGLTSIIVKISDDSETKIITDAINSKLDANVYHAMAWQEMSPEILQQIQSDKVSGIFMIGVLYMIIAFGVFGTVLMMAEERKKEFAVMIAIGVQKTKLVMQTFYETLFMNSLGIIIGVLITVPLVYYYHIHPIEMTGEAAQSIEKFGIEPILPTILSFSIFLNQILVILVITALASIYSFISIMKMNVIKSIRK
jgi:ABC-type lipoprotein release transport system permease subunit